MSDSASVSTFFHGYASDFDSIYGNKHSGFRAWVNTNLRASMRLRYEATIEGCQPIEGKSVLDIGSGPGHFAVHLAKIGAGRVVGLDFAEGMMDVARKNAEAAGVSDKCDWTFGDFLEYDSGGEKFDYTIVCGFMDYIKDAPACVKKVLSLTKGRAMFSFPKAGGFLAWQRAMRYKMKCPLYLYSEKQLQSIFAAATEGTDAKVDIRLLKRDYFVTVTMPESEG